MLKNVNPDAPRPYFPLPQDLGALPGSPALPDLFQFLDPSADPAGLGRVEKPEQWAARREELKDLLKYYLYGSRLDPRKEDTTVTAIRENYRYIWAEGILPPGPGFFGSPEPPKLPEGSCTMREMDFSAFGMGKFYMDIAPEEGFVHRGEDYVLPGSLGLWRSGEGWEAHRDLVRREKLPNVTVEITIRDTNPANAPWRSAEAAAVGVKHSFDLRYPAEAPTVDGLRRGPEGREGRGYPVLVCLGGLSEAQIVTLNENGYVYLSVNDATSPRNGEAAKYELLYPPVDTVVHHDLDHLGDWHIDSGNLMHSGWMASRALDALENYERLSRAEKEALNPEVILPRVDTFAAAITGCSNNGKRAIVGGVFDTGDGGDTRFSVIAPSDPGGGGASGFRCSTEGQLFSYEPPVQNSPGGPVVHDYAYGFNETTGRAIQNTGEDNWFCDRAQVFTLFPALAEHVPIDAHSLLAAFASAEKERFIITWTGEGQDAWLNSPATVLNTWAAREVFEFLGQGENIAVIVRDQAHANQDRDMADLIAVMDLAFYGARTVLRKYHASLAGPDGLLAADGSGAILPPKEFRSLAEMERNPYFLPSNLLKWSRPGKHTLWTEANSVTQGVPLTLLFHTDAERLELRLPDGRVLSAPAEGGLAKLELGASEAQPGCYLAKALGSLAPKSIELRGWTVSDALRHAVTDNSALGHDVGTGAAFTTPVVNTDEDPVRLYLSGIPLPADRWDYDNQVLWEGKIVPQSGYIQPYGATVTLYEGTVGRQLPLGEKAVFSLRNLKLEALQGFVLNLDIGLVKFDPNEGREGAAPRMRFRTTCRALSTQTPSWPPERRQDTPRLGLPAGEERWPLPGNWASDFDARGALRPLEEIRPCFTASGECACRVRVTAEAADRSGFSLRFSEPVDTADLGLAIRGVPGFSWAWDREGSALRVTYDAPPTERTLTVFVFRFADLAGNLTGAPTELNIPAE